MPSRKLPKNEIIVSDYRKGLSTGQIAEKYNVSSITVVSCLRRIGEPRRDTTQAAKLREKSGRAIHVKYWLGKKQPSEMIEKRISKIRGSNHYLWKGGKSRRPYRKIISKEKCDVCKSRLNLCIHHVDHNHYNDNPENLRILCLHCHISHHKKEYWKRYRNEKSLPISNAPIGWNR